MSAKRWCRVRDSQELLIHERANSQSLKKTPSFLASGSSESSVAIEDEYGERHSPGLEKSRRRCRRLGHLPERFDGELATVL
jgi:hypothetical protein